MRTNKRYFKCFKLLGDRTKIDYWHTSEPSELFKMYDFIQPLGYRKPKLEEIKE